MATVNECFVPGPMDLVAVLHCPTMNLAQNMVYKNKGSMRKSPSRNEHLYSTNQSFRSTIVFSNRSPSSIPVRRTLPHNSLFAGFPQLRAAQH